LSRRRRWPKLYVALELLVSSRRRRQHRLLVCPGALGLKQEKEAYTPCCPRALGLEILSLEKAAFSPCSLGALGLEQEKVTYAPCCPGALALETLSLGLERFEREEESLMDERFEQASACLK
jgi:hypothetical protein